MAGTLTEIRQSGRDFNAQLEAAGIRARLYSRPPSGFAKNMFAISTEQAGNGIIWWPGEDIGLSLTADSERHQAVLQVTEQARDFIIEVRQGHECSHGEKSYAHKACVLKHDRDRILNLARASTALPESARLYFLDGAWKGARNPHRRSPVSPRRTETFGGQLTCRVQVKVAKATTTNLLLGIDESAHFIAELPKAAKTVEAALRLLRPKNLPKDAPRQGEFFFVPANQDEIRQIEKMVIRPRQRYDRGAMNVAQNQKVRNGRLEQHSSHCGAEVARIGGEKYDLGGVYYVKGWVRDGRTDRHEDLKFDSWMRVVRNLEVVRAGAPRQTVAGQRNTPVRHQRWD